MEDKGTRILDGSNEQTTKNLKKWMGLEENQDFSEHKEDEGREK